jgi:RNA polymerase sigma-70 factor (sigma-E family)
MDTLVEQASSLGESDRLGELYRTHAPTALRVAYLITGDRALSQDLVHEAFIKVAGRLFQLRDAAAFGAYLNRAVSNLATSHFRHETVKRRHLSAATAEPSHEPTADVDTREELWAALHQLSERQRAAIVLRYYLDLSDDEAARVLGCRTGTVRSLMSRGLQTLREEVRHG